MYKLYFLRMQAVGIAEGFFGIFCVAGGLPAGWLADRMRRDRLLRIFGCIMYGETLCECRSITAEKLYHSKGLEFLPLHSLLTVLEAKSTQGCWEGAWKIQICRAWLYDSIIFAFGAIGHDEFIIQITIDVCHSIDVSLTINQKQSFRVDNNYICTRF